MCECIDDKLVISRRSTNTVNHSAMTEIRNCEVGASLHSAHYHLLIGLKGHDQRTSSSCFFRYMQ